MQVVVVSDTERVFFAATFGLSFRQRKSMNLRSQAVGQLFMEYAALRTRQSQDRAPARLVGCSKEGGMTKTTRRKCVSDVFGNT